MDYKTYHLIAAARTRNWGIILSHLLCAPVASVVYSAKQKNPWAAVVATAVFTLGIPFSVVDLGLTMTLGAPIVSIAMLTGKGGESRRRLGIFSPEEADMLLYNNGNRPL